MEMTSRINVILLSFEGLQGIWWRHLPVLSIQLNIVTHHVLRIQRNLHDNVIALSVDGPTVWNSLIRCVIRPSSLNALCGT